MACLNGIGSVNISLKSAWKHTSLHPKAIDVQTYMYQNISKCVIFCAALEESLSKPDEQSQACCGGNWWSTRYLTIRNPSFYLTHKANPTTADTVVGNGITMTSKWARWRLKSPASRLFTQPFIQGADQRNIKLRVTGPCEGNSPVTGEIIRTMYVTATDIKSAYRRHVKTRLCCIVIAF